MNIQVGVDSPMTRFSAAARPSAPRQAFGNAGPAYDRLSVHFGNGPAVKPEAATSESILVRIARRAGQVVPSRDRWLKTSVVLGTGGVLGGLFNGPVLQALNWGKSVAWDAPMSFFLNNLYGMDNSFDVAAAAGTTVGLDIAVAVLTYRGVRRLWENRRVGYEKMRDAKNMLNGASRNAVKSGVDEDRVKEIVKEALSTQTGDLAAAVVAAMQVQQASGGKGKRKRTKVEDAGKDVNAGTEGPAPNRATKGEETPPAGKEGDGPDKDETISIVADADGEGKS